MNKPAVRITAKSITNNLLMGYLGNMGTQFTLNTTP